LACRSYFAPICVAQVQHLQQREDGKQTQQHQKLLLHQLHYRVGSLVWELGSGRTVQESWVLSQTTQGHREI
jgi:hypothetical protein